MLTLTISGGTIGTREMLQLASSRYALCTSLLGVITLLEKQRPPFDGRVVEARPDGEDYALTGPTPNENTFNLSR
ncbi:hypothetical protein PILCRDRAFT_818143 [Piloderma croceum F 1598]|uniref:Uncharacterized protein n=1 Tax=Piloderma croceum (strain F 1598) TaxID=765440 RepID=A0A0C3G1F3_PILCF|nr:hypothetical protein PILCRDRAFT_818143 [Piloderma croceum F 1598]